MPDSFVHYGSHVHAPTTWRNFDASPTLRLQRLPLVGAFFARGDVPVFPSNVEFGDIVKGLPVTANSCHAIYASHVLEHLSLDDCRIALGNTHEYLRDGGLFRLVVPDLEQLCRAYLASTEAEASIRFMDESMLGERSRARGLTGFLRTWIGNSAHRWMWDYKGLAAELQRVGFRQIRRAQFGDAPLPQFADVENADRWRDCLGIECSK
jgi:hypothetical protein